MLHLPPFVNVPLFDFNGEADRHQAREAVKRVRAQLGREYPLVIGGRRIPTGDTFQSRNPAQPDEVVGVIHAGGPGHVEQAVQAAWDAFERWRWLSPEERAHLFLRAASLARKRRMDFIAWEALEVGKNWNEANGEIAEVVDHFEWYARELVKYAQGQPLPSLPGEVSEYIYEPLGAGVVISPWNFPFALASGMILGALAAGNTVVWKPAEYGTACAHQFLQLLEDAGFPPGVVNLVSGFGHVAGTALVNHPRVRFVSFVGSKAVGLQVYQQASVVQPGQRWLKRVITEMGGKNATIVAADADLEVAVDAIVRAAYGFQGQKCSAGSRALVEASRYDEVLERLKVAAESLQVGPPEENYPLGPVINAQAEEKIQMYLDLGQREGRLVTGGKKLGRQGYYLTPTIFADVAPDARVAQEEIFGPVLSVIRVENFEQALAVANSTEYALTGAVISKDPEKLEAATRRFYCGNLYMNRPATGAMAGVHPFGGFNMSGTGPKVGGPDYLQAYLQAKVIVRRLG